MPLVQLTIIEGRDSSTIGAAIVRVTDALEETLAAPREAIRVIVHEVPATHWGVGGVPKTVSVAVPQGTSAPRSGLVR